MRRIYGPSRQRGRQLQRKSTWGRRARWWKRARPTDDAGLAEFGLVFPGRRANTLRPSTGLSFLAETMRISSWILEPSLISSGWPLTKPSSQPSPERQQTRARTVGHTTAHRRVAIHCAHSPRHSIVPISHAKASIKLASSPERGQKGSESSSFSPGGSRSPPTLCGSKWVHSSLSYSLFLMHYLNYPLKCTYLVSC